MKEVPLELTAQTVGGKFIIKASPYSKEIHLAYNGDHTREANIVLDRISFWAFVDALAQAFECAHAEPPCHVH